MSSLAIEYKNAGKHYTTATDSVTQANGTALDMRWDEFRDGAIDKITLDSPLDSTNLGRDASNNQTIWKENPFTQDYRMSVHTDMVVPGHGVQYDTTSYDSPVSTEFLATTIYQSLSTYDTAGVPPQMYGFSADAPSGRHYTMDLAIAVSYTHLTLPTNREV